MVKVSTAMNSSDSRFVLFVFKRRIPLGLVLLAGLQGVAFADLKSKYQDEQREEVKTYEHCLNIFKRAQYDSNGDNRNNNFLTRTERFYIDGENNVVMVVKTVFHYPRVGGGRQVDCGYSKEGSMAVETKCLRLGDGGGGYYNSCHSWQYAIENGTLVRYLNYKINPGNTIRKVVGRAKVSKPIRIGGKNSQPQNIKIPDCDSNSFAWC